MGRLKSNGCDGAFVLFAALYKVDENPEKGMWMLYLTIVVLSIIVYKLGFAKNFLF